MISGGKRNGAGRPTKEDKKVPLTIKIKPYLKKWLKKQPAGQGPTVERLIEREIENETKK